MRRAVEYQFEPVCVSPAGLQGEITATRSDLEAAREQFAQRDAFRQAQCDLFSSALRALTEQGGESDLQTVTNELRRTLQEVAA